MHFLKEQCGPHCSEYS